MLGLVMLQAKGSASQAGMYLLMTCGLTQAQIMCWFSQLINKPQMGTGETHMGHAGCSLQHTEGSNSSLNPVLPDACLPCAVEHASSHYGGITQLQSQIASFSKFDARKLLPVLKALTSRPHHPSKADRQTHLATLRHHIRPSTCLTRGCP